MSDRCCSGLEPGDLLVETLDLLGPAGEGRFTVVDFFLALFEGVHAVLLGRRLKSRQGARAIDLRAGGRELLCRARGLIALLCELAAIVLEVPRLPFQCESLLPEIAALHVHRLARVGERQPFAFHLALLGFAQLDVALALCEVVGAAFV